MIGMLVPLVSIGLSAACSVPVLSADDIYALAVQAGFPPDMATNMTAVALRESGGCPTAYNNTPPDNSYGLWQINLYPGAQSLAALGLSNASQLFDLATNAAAAFAIWNGSSSNFSIAWGSVPQQFLAQAQQAANDYGGDSGDTLASDASGDSGAAGGFLGLSQTQLAVGGAILAGLLAYALT